MTGHQVKKSTARRNLLKALVAGGGAFAMGRTLPESWAKPLVKSVILPAHAQTSPASFDGYYMTPLIVGSNEQTNDVAESMLDMFVPPAEAACTAPGLQISISGDEAQVCLSIRDKSQILSYQGATHVNTATGDLDDITNFGGTGYNLESMQVTEHPAQVTGTVSCNGAFKAPRTAGTFNCIPVENVTSRLQLSTPFEDIG